MRENSAIKMLIQVVAKIVWNSSFIIILRSQSVWYLIFAHVIGFWSSMATLVTFSSRFISSQNSRKKTRSKNPKNISPTRRNWPQYYVAVERSKLRPSFIDGPFVHWHFHFVGQKEFFLKKKLLEVEKLVVWKGKKDQNWNAAFIDKDSRQSISRVWEEKSWHW